MNLVNKTWIFFLNVFSTSTSNDKVYKKISKTNAAVFWAMTMCSRLIRDSVHASKHSCSKSSQLKIHISIYELLSVLEK